MKIYTFKLFVQIPFFMMLLSQCATSFATETSNCVFTDDVTVLTRALLDSDSESAYNCDTDAGLTSAVSVPFSTANIGETATNANNSLISSAYLPDLTLPNTVWQTNIESKVAQLGQGFAGDSIDESSGSLSFRHVDVSLPGNNHLPVEFARTYRINGIDYSGNILGGWTPDVPFITLRLDGDIGIIFDGGNGSETTCLANAAIRLSGASGDSHQKIINNLRMSIPGQGIKSLISPSALSVNHPYHITGGNSFLAKTGSTTDHWKVECSGAMKNDVLGQAMKATAPNGDQYYFDVFVKRYAGFETHITTDGGRGDGNSVFNSNQLFHYILYASKVVDLNGNEVNYNYDTDGYLTQISSTDGRTIDIAYNAANVNAGSLDPFTEEPYESFYKSIKSVKANGRTWTYAYASEADDNYHNATQLNLRTVTRPDGKQWTLNLPLQNNRATEYYNSYRCWAADKYKAHGYSGSWLQRLTAQTYVVHPEGTRVDYEFALIKNAGGLINFPAKSLTGLDEDLQDGVNDEYCAIRFSDMTVARAVTEKQITTTDTTTYTWQYDYDQSNHCRPADTTISAKPTKKRSITHPDGIRTDKYFYCGNAEHGQLAHQKIYDGLTLLETRSFEFATETFINAFGPASDNFREHRTLLSKQTIKQGTDEYTKSLTYKTDLSSLEYSYGQPVQITQSNSVQTTPRVHNFKYKHDRDNWILQKLEEIKLGSTSLSKVTLDALGRPTHHYQFGALVGRFTYKEAEVEEEESEESTEEESGPVTKPVAPTEIGTLNEYFDALGNRTYFTDYKAGIAQEMLRPDDVWVKRTVDGNGWITKVVDGKSHCTNYQYNGVGRLTLIEPCDTQWSNTTISYETTTDNESLSHVTAGMFKQTITQGDYQKVSYLDSLLRPRLVKEWDTTQSSTQKYFRSGFDYVGRQTYQSKPFTDSTTPNGIDSTYDGLGRLTKVDDSTIVGSTRYTYLDGQKIKKTDNENNQTTTTYLAYGMPSFEQALKIESPEEVTTDIAINPFGNVTSIKQSGKDKDGVDISLTEYRAYDSLQQLCKIKRGDVGQTVFEYNLLGQVKWQAEGTSGGTNTDCVSDADASNKVAFTYDSLGNVKTIIYPGTSGFTRTFGYDNNGNVSSIASGNVVQTYNYNSLDLLDDESLTHSDKSFSLNYAYDALGNLSSLTYPDGDSIDYAPNGLGQPSTAIRKRTNQEDYSYASGATYYANGMIDTFNYGNGFTHKTTLNAAQLPISIRDKKSTVNALHYEYEYDGNLNITKLTDNIDDAYNLTGLKYDGLDRLIETTDNAGIGRSVIEYDGLGNITRYKSKNSDLDYTYNYAVDATYGDTKVNTLRSVVGVGTAAKSYLSFDYDDRGNVTNNSYNLFNFNSANQLVSATPAGGDGFSYLYDGYNRRVKQTDSNGTKFSLYSQAGTLLYSEKDGQGINYIYLGKKLIAKDGFIPKNSSKQHYRPYGDSIEGAIDDVGYTGHKFDTDLGLSYMQARYYDPVIGRFYSNDPVGTLAHLNDGNIQGFNRYAYANNNPYKYVDPDGRVPLVPIAIAGGRACAANPACRTAAVKGAKHVVKGARRVADAVSSILGAVFNESSDDTSDSSDQDSSDGKKAKDSGKNSRHGDSGRALDKAEGQIADLETQLEGAPKKEKKKIKQKIKNIKQDAERKRRGEEHSRGAKR